MVTLLQLRSQGCERAIDSRRDGGNRRIRDEGDFLQRELLLKSKNKSFARVRVELLHGAREPLGIFRPCCKQEGRRGGGGWRWGCSIPLSTFRRVKAEGSALAEVVESEIARDAEEPGLEAGMAVVGGAALEDTKPGFLHEIVDALAPAEQINEIANKAVLILLD